MFKNQKAVDLIGGCFYNKCFRTRECIGINFAQKKNKYEY